MKMNEMMSIPAVEIVFDLIQEELCMKKAYPFNCSLDMMPEWEPNNNPHNG